MSAPVFDWPRILAEIPEAKRDMVRAAVEKAVAQYLDKNAEVRPTQRGAWEQFVRQVDKLTNVIEVLGSPDRMKRLAKELANGRRIAEAYVTCLKPRDRLNRLYSAIFATWEAARSAPRVSDSGPYVRFHQAIMKSIGRELDGDSVSKFVQRERERLAAQQIALPGKGQLKADATLIRPGALRWWDEDH